MNHPTLPTDGLLTASIGGQPGRLGAISYADFAPPSTVDALRLEFPANRWGAAGVFRFTIPPR